ncbi:MAG TPA: MFS transporter [Aliidongia sp.]|uniref:MFS transporter n=1 Tax=Aliidongia sp. TaxID=1914230 RepID=UPI002DDDB538|nr:MFS transporter [Aliidongia sp.]HEV2673633.1 MFS transporter [Aliidongia sp.]
MIFDKFPVRGRILVLLTLGSLLVGLDRAGLAPAVEGVRDALRVPSPALDISFSAYSLGFFLSLAFIGLLVERLGSARVLLGCGILAAVAMVATTATVHVIGLALSRLVLGLAAGGLLPAATVMLAQWIPQQERGAAQGLIHGAYWLGPLVAGSLVGAAEALGSWRGAFLVLAGLGGAWCFLWYRMGAGLQAAPDPLPIYWRGHIRRFLLPFGLAFAQSWAIALVIQWVPAYQLETWHLNIIGSPLLTGVTAAAAACGVVGGGYASDWVLRDSGNIRPARQLLPGIGFLGATIGLFAMPGQHEIETIILSTGVTLFFLTLATAPLWSLALDISAEHPAIGSLFIGLGAALAQLAGPLTLAHMTKAWWLGPTLGLPMLLAAGIAAFNLRPDLGIPEPPPPPTDEEEDEKTAAKKPAKKH